MIETSTETPDWVLKFCRRWEKKVFGNDVISSRPSTEFEGAWEIVITRGIFEAILTLDSMLYGNPRMYDNPKLLLSADREMRFQLARVKERQSLSSSHGGDDV